MRLYLPRTLEVLAAASGTEALRMLEQHPAVDLLFTDVVMPGSLDGRQLAEAAQRLLPDLPVLFTSGYTEDAIVHQGRLGPGMALLTKPYRLPELAASLAAALASPPDAPPKS